MTPSLPEACRHLLQIGIGVLAQSTLLLLLGLLAAGLLRRRSPALRSFVSQTTLAGVALGAILSATLSGHVRPLWGVSLPSVTALTPVASDRPSPEGQGEGRENSPISITNASPLSFPFPGRESGAVAPGTGGLPPGVGLPPGEGHPADPAVSSAPPSPPNPQASLDVALAGLWAGVTALLLLWLAMCQCHLARLRRQSAAITSPPVVETLARLAVSHNIHSPQLLASPRVRSPFLTGVLRPAILLPAAWETVYDDTTLHVILAHEAAHLARRDCTWTLFLRLTSAVLWIQPLLWLLGRQLDQSSEEACDLMALTPDCPPGRYADCLLALAQCVLPRPAERTLGAGVVPVRSALGHRIQNILDRRNQTMPPLSPPLRLGAILATAVAAGCGVILVAASGPAQTVAPAKPTPPPVIRTVPVTPLPKAAPDDALAQAKFLAGLTPVQGPGVIVTLTDSKKRLPPNMLVPGMEPPSIIHDTDINQVINELKAAGAEAFNVNGQRLVATTAIRCVGPVTLVNNVPQTPPFVIRAIGPSETLKAALSVHGGVMDQIRTFDPAMVRIETAQHLTLPAYQGDTHNRYAQPVTATAIIREPPTSTPRARSFQVLWRVPRQGTHHVQIFGRDAGGIHLLLEKIDCRAGENLVTKFTTTLPHVSFLIYDNGHLIYTARDPRSEKPLEILYGNKDTSRNSQQRAVSELARLQRERDQAQLQREVAQNSVVTYERLADNEMGSRTARISVLNTTLHRLRKQIAVAKAQDDALAAWFTPRHPRRQSRAVLNMLQQEYQDLQKQLNAPSRPNAEYSVLLNQGDAAQAEAARAQAMIAHLDAQIRLLPGKGDSQR